MSSCGRSGENRVGEGKKEKKIRKMFTQSTGFGYIMSNLILMPYSILVHDREIKEEISILSYTCTYMLEELLL